MFQDPARTKDEKLRCACKRQTISEKKGVLEWFYLRDFIVDVQ